VRPGRKTGIRWAARRERVAIVWVGRAGSGGSTGGAGGGGGRVVVKLTTIVVVIVVVVAAVVDSREDILRTVRSVIG
jgi:predicted metalloprotease